MITGTLKHYNRNAPQLTNRYEKADVRLLHEKLRNTFAGASKCLEIGCGSGREASYMLRHGFDVRGIEGSPAMTAEAVRIHPELNGRIDVRVLPEQFPLEDTYDGVYSIAVLMHFSKRTVYQIITNVFSILQPGGKFLFSVPLTRPDLTGSGIDSSGRFFLLLKEPEWIKMTKEAGFSILDTEVTNDGMARADINWCTCIAQKSP